VTPDATFTIAGRVVRSRIIKLPQGGLGYDVAVVFNEPLLQVPSIPAAVERAAAAAPAGLETVVAPEHPAAEETATVTTAAVPAPTTDSSVHPPSTAGGGATDAVEEGAPAGAATGLTAEELAANAAAIAAELDRTGDGPETWSSAMFHVTAMINRSGEQVLELFEGNNW